MKMRSNIILFFIVGLLAVLTFVVLRPPHESPRGGTLLGKSFKSSDVISMSFSQGTSTLELIKDDKDWKSSDTVVDSQKVSEFLSAIGTDSIVFVVSNNKSNAQNFGVDELTGKIVKLTTHNTSFDVVLGSIAQQFGRYYARGLHSDETVVAEGKLTQLFSTKLEDWTAKPEEKK